MEIATYLYYSIIPITFLAIHLFISHFCKKSSHKLTPPSPATCLPIIGHFHILREPFHTTLADLADQYGPILSLRFGSRPVLLVSSPSAAEECLSKCNVVLCNRPGRAFLIAKYVDFDYTGLIWAAPYGPHWRNLRRISNTEVYSSFRLKLLAPIRSDEVKRIIQRLYKVCITTWSPSIIIEMKGLMHEVTMNVITRVIFGKRYYGVEDEESQKFREMMTTLVRLFNDASILGDMVPCLRWLDYWPKKRSLRKFEGERRVVLSGLMEEHKVKMKVLEDRNEECNQPLIQFLLKLQESRPEYYTDDILSGLILDLLIGSMDTSAETMEWLLSLLLNHPEVLSKAKAEIHNQVGYERLLEESDLNHLPYLRCIINETLRMYPPAPFLVPEQSSDDCMVGGYHVPRGTMLQINLWAIQNDPKIWDDPRSFRPERFEGVEGHKVGYKMMPFGSGRRSCLGESLATRVIGLTIGSIIQCFELGRIDHELVDMTKASGFNMLKAKPLRARVRPCEAMTQLLDQIM